MTAVTEVLVEMEDRNCHQSNWEISRNKLGNKSFLST